MPVPRSAARISVRVDPGAARSEVAGFSQGVLRVKVSAPPVKGKANKELIALLTDLFGVNRGSVTILKGHTTRNKIVAIDGLSQTEVIKRLS